MLPELFGPDSVSLSLAGTTRDEVLGELVQLVQLDSRGRTTLQKLLRRREALGSTAVGRGVAIPHSRSLVVNRLHLAYGHHPEGIAYDALDGKPVHHFFLIVAPPMEISNQYLPVLGRVAQLVKEPDVPERLASLTSPEGFFDLLREKGA